MVENKYIVIKDLENIEVKIENENVALLLLSSLLRSFEHFKDPIIYGKECTIILNEARASMRSKEF